MEKYILLLFFGFLCCAVCQREHFAVAVITDGGLDKPALPDDVGSEEDLYEDFRSSAHRYGHPGGGGEQLAINEVGAGVGSCPGGCWPGNAARVMEMGLRPWAG